MSDRLTDATVAVIGFGNQGEAQALALRDAGLQVIVGARAGKSADSRARSSGFSTFSLPQAARRADFVAMLLPDEVTPQLWGELSAELSAASGIIFAHGFNLLYADLQFPASADVVLVSPTAPGRELTRAREKGEPLPAYLAVHRDGSGSAWDLAAEYAGRLGCAPLWRTTVREETEVDLFGEQAVLCGGMNALVTAAFETLVARGFQPEMAYLECVHQLKYLADLLHERGMRELRQSISGTALFGDLTRGPRVIGKESRSAMAAILAEIQNGTFAKEWQQEVAARRSRLDSAVEAAARHPMENARRRALSKGAGD